ncbi:hypothetical protein [Ralstonia pseudosolanacearum]
MTISIPVGEKHGSQQHDVVAHPLVRVLNGIFVRDVAGLQESPGIYGRG